MVAVCKDVLLDDQLCENGEIYVGVSSKQHSTYDENISFKVSQPHLPSTFMNIYCLSYDIVYIDATKPVCEETDEFEW